MSTTDPRHPLDKPLDGIDQARLALAMLDAGYKWEIAAEDVEFLLDAYDALSTTGEVDAGQFAAGWRPIDSAPKDGTPVLLSFFLFASNRFHRYIAKWDTDLMRWARDESGDYIFPEHMQGVFSHWMPLSSPPSDQVGGGL